MVAFTTKTCVKSRKTEQLSTLFFKREYERGKSADQIQHPMNNNKLDETDRQLLRILQEDSKQTTKEIAAQVHLSPTPVFERIKTLEKEGYIKKYAAVLDREKMQDITVFCNIRLKQHSKEYMLMFIKAVNEIEEITDCYNISGDYDYLLKIVARDMDHYQSFVQNRLGVVEAIGSLHSIFVLKEVKQTYAIPI